MYKIRSTNALAYLVTLTTLVAAPAAAFAKDAYTVDPGHTSVIFRVKHLGVSNFYGRFNKMSGSFSLDATNPSNSEVQFEIDANSVYTADKKRDKHLRSPDFFASKQFPKITFKSSQVRKLSNNKYAVTGKLTLRGVSKNITINVEQTGQGNDPWGNFRTGFEASFTINRLDYGVKYMPEGLGKDVHIIVAVAGIKKK